jgi:hypothetical protein
LVHQRRLAVIDVGDDRDVAYGARHVSGLQKGREYSTANVFP